jgi:hypothetical protein
MEFLGYLAPVAFVFALGALAQAQDVKKKLDQVSAELSLIRDELSLADRN